MKGWVGLVCWVVVVVVAVLLVVVVVFVVTPRWNAARCISYSNSVCLSVTLCDYVKQETHQEMRDPNVTSLNFATPLAFNAPGRGLRWDDLRKILRRGQRMAKVDKSSSVDEIPESDVMYHLITLLTLCVIYTTQMYHRSSCIIQNLTPALLCYWRQWQG